MEKIKLNRDEAEQLWNEIENQGFGYWVQEYGYKEDKDQKLKELSEKAREAMNELDEHVKKIWGKYDIG